MPLLVGQIIARERIAAEKRRRLAIHATLPPDLPLLMIDPHAIERVLINLLDNAVSFTPDDGMIAVEAAAEPDCVRVSVADSGPGIPPGQQLKVFEPFYSTKRESDRGHGHLGTGLATAQQIAADHGGTVEIDPDKTAGCRVRVVLPVRRRS